MIQQRLDEFGEEKKEDKGKEERGERKEGIAIIVLVLIGVGGGGGGEEWSNVQGDGKYTNVADEEGVKREGGGEVEKEEEKEEEGEERKWTWTTKRTKATKLKRRTTVRAIPTRHAATATVRTAATAIRSTERGGGWCPIASNRWC